MSIRPSNLTIDEGVSTIVPQSEAFSIDDFKGIIDKEGLEKKLAEEDQMVTNPFEVAFDENG